MKSQELKDEIILDIKTAINHYGSLDPDYGIIQLDDNNVDHIAEDVATLAMVRNESYWTKALQLQQKRDVQ